MRRVIGVVSGKGGVGKTTFVANVGLAVTGFDEESIVIDADLFTSNLGLQLGLYKSPLGLQDALEGGISVYDIIHTHHSGLKIIPTSMYPSHLFKKTVTPYRLKSLLKDIYSLILIDSPPGLGKEVFFVLKACDEVLVVTNPDIPSVTDAMRVISAARELKKDPINIVVNRVKDDYELKPEEIEMMCDAPVIGEIPEDKMIKRSLFEKTPLIHYSPHSPAAVAFKKIAANILGIDYKPPSLLRLRRIFRKF